MNEVKQGVRWHVFRVLVFLKAAVYNCERQNIALHCTVRIVATQKPYGAPVEPSRAFT